MRTNIKKTKLIEILTTLTQKYGGILSDITPIATLRKILTELKKEEKKNLSTQGQELLEESDVPLESEISADCLGRLLDCIQLWDATDKNLKKPSSTSEDALTALEKEIGITRYNLLWFLYNYFPYDDDRGSSSIYNVTIKGDQIMGHKVDQNSMASGVQSNKIILSTSFDPSISYYILKDVIPRILKFIRRKEDWGIHWGWEEKYKPLYHISCQPLHKQIVLPIIDNFIQRHPSLSANDFDKLCDYLKYPQPYLDGINQKYEHDWEYTLLKNKLSPDFRNWILRTRYASLINEANNALSRIQKNMSNIKEYLPKQDIGEIPLQEKIEGSLLLSLTDDAFLPMQKVWLLNLMIANHINDATTFHAILTMNLQSLCETAACVQGLECEKKTYYLQWIQHNFFHYKNKKDDYEYFKKIIDSLQKSSIINIERKTFEQDWIPKIVEMKTNALKVFHDIVCNDFSLLKDIKSPQDLLKNITENLLKDAPDNWRSAYFIIEMHFSNFFKQTSHLDQTLQKTYEFFYLHILISLGATFAKKWFYMFAPELPQEKLNIILDGKQTMMMYTIVESYREIAELKAENELLKKPAEKKYDFSIFATKEKMRETPNITPDLPLFNSDRKLGRSKSF